MNFTATYELYVARWNYDKNWVTFEWIDTLGWTANGATNLYQSTMLRDKEILECLIEDSGTPKSAVEIVKIKANFEIIKE